MRHFLRSFVRTRVVAGGIIVGALFISASLLYFQPDKASSLSWWDESWMYRQVVSITNASGSDLTDYQVSFTLDTSTLITAGKMKADCADIRITDNTGRVLPFWIEENSQVCNSASTRIWVKHPLVQTTGAILYMYYGNSNANVSVYGANTFEYFDNFSDGSIASNYVYGGGTIVESSGNISLINDADGWDTYIFPNTNHARPSVMQARFRAMSGTRSMIGWHDPGTGVSYTDLVYGIYFNNGSFTVYEDGANRSVAGHTYTVGNWYDVKIELLTTGAKYYYKASGAASWTLLYTSAYSTENSLRPGVSHYDGTAGEYSYLDDLIVRKYASTEPTDSTVGSEEVGPAPEGYWKFDDGYGTTAGDSSGNNHTASLVSGTAWQTEDQCVNGKCLKFDGVDDIVTMGVGSDYFPMNTFSICTWVKTPGLGTGMTKAGIVSMTYGLIFELNGSGQFQTTMDNGASLVNSAISRNLFDNVYHHLCLTYDGTQRHMYIDGVKELSANTTWLGTTRWPTNSVTLGTNNNNSMYKLNGFMDEVKFYPYARTADQIKSDYVSRGDSKGSTVVLGSPDNSALNNGLVGYWKMNEASWNGTAGEVIDASAAGNHGTRGGNATTAAGKYGNGGTFDGSGDYVLVPATSTLDLQNLTVVSWNYATNYDQNMFMFEKTTNGSVNTQYSLFYDTGGTSSRIYFRTVGLSPQDLSVADNAAGPVVSKWNMIVGTYDASTGTKKIFINGTLAATQTGVTGTIATNPAGTSWIGTYGGGVGYPFNGRIDETRIYNRALSESEVSDLYRWAPGPVGYWDFENDSTTTFNDKSGSGLSMSVTGTTTFEKGPVGNAFRVEGTSVTGVTAATSILNTDYHTIGFWIKFNQTSPASYRKFFGYTPSGTDRSPGIWTYPSANCLHWRYDPSNSGPASCGGPGGSSTYFTNGQWYHVAGVKDGGIFYFYVDGQMVLSGAVSNPKIAGTSAITLGAGSPYISLDDVRIYNYARTQDQIIQDMGASAVAGANSDPLPAPVVYFPLDEGYGTTTNNSGGGASTLNGTLQNGPSWSSSGKVGKALSLDGTNDYLEVPNNTTLKYTGGDFTLSAWVNRNAAETNQGRIFSKPWNGSGQYNYVLMVNNDTTLIFSLLGATSWQTSTTDTLPANAWTHLLVTVDGNSKGVKIYKNGALIKSDTHNITNWTPTIADANLPLAVGTLYPYGGAWGGVASHAFHGFIDEVKVYNAALTPEQALKDYNSGAPEVMGSVSTTSDGVTPDNSAGREYCVPGDTGACASPVVEFKLDENSGTTIYDTSGSGYSSTAFLGSPTWVAGKKSGALSFNGTTDGVSFSGPTTYATMTMTSWVYIDSASPTGDIVGYAHTNSNAYGFTFYIEGNTLRAKAETNADQYFYSNVTYDVTALKNKWIHLGMTWQNLGTGAGGCDAEVKLYVNGALVDSATDNVTNTPYSCSVPYPYPFTMGATTANSLTRATKVKLDDIRVYNYVRTPAQIAWEYNKGGPIVHYKFDECEGTTIYNSAATGNDEPVGINGTLTIGGSGSNTAVGTCATSGAWADGATGKEGASMDFDGTDDRVTASSSLNLDGVNESIFMWVKHNNSNYIFSGGLSGWARRFFTTNITLIDTNSVYYTLYTTGSNDNNWHHIGYTVQSGQLKSYVDGVVVTSLNTTSGANLNPRALTPWVGNVCSGASCANWYTGQVDDIRIFNYALTAAQVRDIHNNGAVSFK